MDACTQFLCFELGPACNLGHVHAKCPNRSERRYSLLDTSATLSDDKIAEVATAAYRDYGFRGLVGWHYYNEPLLYRNRMFRLMDKIKQAVPEAGFVLWTNGTMIPENCQDFAKFSQIHVTDYTTDGHPPKNIEALTKAAPHAKVHRWPLDSRLEPIRGTEPRTAPCMRPFTEFIVDAFGNVHICCYDWRGEASPGNVMTQPIGDVVFKWNEVRRSIAGNAMEPWAPECCRICPIGIGAPITSFVSVPADIAHSMSRSAAIVTVHYSMPYKRIRDFIHRIVLKTDHSSPAAYVVGSDRDAAGEMSRLANHVVVFPESGLPKVDGKPVFSLSATKNAGIKAALRDNHDIIICTDSDCEFPAGELARMRAIARNEVAVPVYHMKTWPDRDDPQDHIDHGCTGTIAMAAEHWKRFKFDEACVGYGGEDGRMISQLRAAGLKIRRDFKVIHHAHTPGVNPRRIPGHGNETCWNRDTGFNPDMFSENIKRGRAATC